MKILLAGASGAIGRILVDLLRAGGNAVFGITHSPEAAHALTAQDVGPILADVLDGVSVHSAITRVRPDVIINELTSLPMRYTPEAVRGAAERDRRVRLVGNTNLLSGAATVGVRRYIIQSSGFWYAPGPGLADEYAPLALNASPAVAAGGHTYAELERNVLGTPGIEGVALRYEFFYGPGKWYTRDGEMAEQVRQRQVPVIGEGQGVWNFVHVENAATATVAAIDSASGVYNVVNSQPSEQRVWLPAFARFARAPQPPVLSEEEATKAAGPDAVYYATKLRGASNEKAARELHFQPRPLEWLAA